MPGDTNQPDPEVEGDEEDHIVPEDLLQLHAAIEAKEAGLL